jgi:hypothetical protein
MTTCASCNQTILFGGYVEDGFRFCNKKCAKKGSIIRDAARIPESDVTPRVWEIRNGRCPSCSGPGPIDLHRSYRVWSGLVMTSYSTRQNVCCARCAQGARMKDAAFSLVFGWWGFPWGLIWTPIQVARNVWAMVRAEDSSAPSNDLKTLVRLQLAAAAAAAKDNPITTYAGVPR